MKKIEGEGDGDKKRKTLEEIIIDEIIEEINSLQQEVGLVNVKIEKIFVQKKSIISVRNYIEDLKRKIEEKSLGLETELEIVKFINKIEITEELLQKIEKKKEENIEIIKFLDGRLEFLDGLIREL